MFHTIVCVCVLPCVSLLAYFVGRRHCPVSLLFLLQLHCRVSELAAECCIPHPTPSDPLRMIAAALLSSLDTCDAAQATNAGTPTGNGTVTAAATAAAEAMAAAAAHTQHTKSEQQQEEEYDSNHPNGPHASVDVDADVDVDVDVGSDGSSVGVSLNRSSSGRARRPTQLMREMKEQEKRTRKAETAPKRQRQKKQKLNHSAIDSGDEGADQTDGGEAANATDAHTSTNDKPNAKRESATQSNRAPPPPHAIIVYHEVEKQSSAYFIVPIPALTPDDLQLLGSLHGAGVNCNALGQMAFERMLRKAAFKSCLGSPLEFGKEFVMEDLRATTRPETSALVTRQKRQRSGKGFHNLWVDKMITHLFDVSFIVDDRPLILPPSVETRPAPVPLATATLTAVPVSASPIMAVPTHAQPATQITNRPSAGYTAPPVAAPIAITPAQVANVATGQTDAAAGGSSTASATAASPAAPFLRPIAAQPPPANRMAQPTAILANVVSGSTTALPVPLNASVVANPHAASALGYLTQNGFQPQQTPPLQMHQIQPFDESWRIAHQQQQIIIMQQQQQQQQQQQLQLHHPQQATAAPEPGTINSPTAATPTTNDADAQMAVKTE